MNILKSLIIILLLCGNAMADDIFSKGVLVCDSTAANCTKPKQINIGTPVDNGDGSVTISVSGSGGVSADTVDSLIYANGGWRVGVDNSIYNFLGTNKVGIGDATPDATFEIVKNGTDTPFMISSLATMDGNYLVVTSAGNVGIGSVNPLSILEISPTGNQTLLKLNSGGTADTFSISRSNNATQKVNIAFYPAGTITASNTLWLFGINDNQSNFAISSYQGSGTLTQRLVLNQSGNVGIGTSAPTSKVEIQATAGQPSLMVSSGATLDGDYLIVTSAGNVGIGSASPIAKLDISGTGTSYFLSNVGIGTSVVTSGALIVTSGNLGIGSIIPEQALVVVGNVKASQVIDSGLTSGRNTYATTNGQLADNSLWVFDGTNVGIGTSVPADLLDVNRKLSVESGGNVGVGTWNPRYKLEVDGTLYAGSTGGYTEIQADGSLYAYGAATWFDDLPITLNPASAVNAPTYTTWKGGRVITLSDEAANEDQIPFTTQFPHSYRFNSPFDFHVHIVGEDTTTCNYRICVDYSLADINKAFPTNGTGCANIANLAVQDAHNYIHLVDITPDPAIYGGYVSTAVVGKFYRNSTNALDTCDGKNVYFIGGDLHLERNTLGSRAETTK